MKGLKWRAYSPATSKHRRAGRRAAGHRAGGRAVAGARDRRRSTRTCRRARPATTPRPTSTSSTATTRRRGCRRTRCIVEQGRVRRARQADAGGACSRPAADAETRGWKLSEEKNGWYIDQLKTERHDDRQAVARSSRPTCGRSATRCSPEWLRQGRRRTARRSSTHTARCSRAPRARIRARARCARTRSTALRRRRATWRRCSWSARWRWCCSAIVGRLLGFNVPGTDAYAGYCMAAAGFLALAHTLKRGEHIRVTLLLEHCAARGCGARSSSGRSPRRRCSRLRSRGTAAARLAVVRSSTTSRPATTRRRCGFRSSRWRSARSCSRSRSSTSWCSRCRGQRAPRRRADEATRTMNDAVDHRRC